MIYTTFRAEYARGNIDPVTDTLVVLLVDETYSFDASHDFIADLVGEITAVDNYGRQTLANKSIVQSDADGVAYFQADHATFANLGGTTDSQVKYAIVAVDTGNDATATLVGAWIQPREDPADPTSNYLSTDGTDWVVRWNALGLFRI